MVWDLERSLARSASRCARVTDIDHTTIINWVKEEGEKLPDDALEEEIPEITEIKV